MNNKRPELIEIACQYCGQPFTSTMKNQLSDEPDKYCDDHEDMAENPPRQLNMWDYV